MAKRKSTTGVLVFGFLCLLIVIIGWIMSCNNQYASRIKGYRNRGRTEVFLSGKDVIIFGMVLLGCSALLYQVAKKDDRT